MCLRHSRGVSAARGCRWVPDVGLRGPGAQLLADRRTGRQVGQIGDQAVANSATARR